MERLKQHLFNLGTSLLGTATAFAFGRWGDLLSFFLLAIAVDYVSGIAASLKEGNGLSSEVGFWGLLKKFLMIVVVFVAHRMDLLLGSDVLMVGAIYFYLANELISVTENYGRLGLPLPDQVKRVIAVLKDRGAENGAGS
jgi:toxin secretion/phage lysis holin